MASPMGTVSLLCLSRPVGPTRPARHSTGWAADLDARLAEHASGRGARMLAAAAARGISWRVTRTWAGTRALERRLKGWKYGPEWCPVCMAARAARGAGR
jgi:hypothetical protein